MSDIYAQHSVEGAKGDAIKLANKMGTAGHNVRETA